MKNHFLNKTSLYIWISHAVRVFSTQKLWAWQEVIKKATKSKSNDGRYFCNFKVV